MKVVKDDEIRVVLAVPSGDDVKTDFMQSVVTMSQHTMRATQGRIDPILTVFRGALLPDSRNVLAIQALDFGATHILWLDSDMKFPPDTLLRLLAHRKAIVGINASMRRAPYAMTAEVQKYEKLVTNEHSTGLEKVYRMGFGVVLIEANVFRKIKKRPYFSLQWISSARQGIGSHRGEDYFFYEKAKRAGFEIFVDQDLSRQVGHVGTFAFYPETDTSGEAS